MLKFLFFLAFLPSGQSGSGTTVETGVISITSRTVKNNEGPENAIDGDTTYYLSLWEGNPEWLKLQLVKPSMVEKVVIISR